MHYFVHKIHHHIHKHYQCTVHILYLVKALGPWKRAYKQSVKWNSREKKNSVGDCDVSVSNEGTWERTKTMESTEQKGTLKIQEINNDSSVCLELTGTLSPVKIYLCHWAFLIEDQWLSSYYFIIIILQPCKILSLLTETILSNYNSLLRIPKRLHN